MMRYTKISFVLTGMFVMCVSAPSFAQSKASGSALYLLHCASCHGPEGLGNGTAAAALAKKPADLTRIAARSAGKFPEETVSRIIDGRNPVKGHGGQGMPAWGETFSRGEGDKSPAAVRARIESVVTYLASIQRK